MKYAKYMMIAVITVGLFQPAFAQFSNKTDGEYATISGKVIEVRPQAFKIQVHDRTILIQMGGQNWDDDGYKLVKGDNVVVNGRVDDGFMEQKKLEASSVYVKGLNTYFYADSEGEDSAPYIPITSYKNASEIAENAHIDIQGEVIEIDKKSFIVHTGYRKVRVNTSDLIYNPLDNKGHTQIDKGDRVRVSGEINNNFFSKDEIQANFVTQLN